MKINFRNADRLFVIFAETRDERVQLKEFIQDAIGYDVPHPKITSYYMDPPKGGVDHIFFEWGRKEDPAQQPEKEDPCRAAECPLKPKPKMLFLDDRTRRVESARRQFGEKWDLTIVSNVKECLRYLSREDYDEVHLDHDLRGCDFEDPDSPESGTEVVRYIEKCGWPGGKKKPIFRIHSKNLFAAHLMVIRLQKLGLYAFYQPFQYDDEEGHMKYDKDGIPIR